MVCMLPMASSFSMTRLRERGILRLDSPYRPSRTGSSRRETKSLKSCGRMSLR